MYDTQFLLLASELRTRAEEILVRAANTNDREVQEMMRVVAAGYEKLARRAEERVRETRQGLASPAPVAEPRSMARSPSRP
jgi:hypothetical protein